MINSHFIFLLLLIYPKIYFAYFSNDWTPMLFPIFERLDIFNEEPCPENCYSCTSATNCTICQQAFYRASNLSCVECIYFDNVYCQECVFNPFWTPEKGCHFKSKFVAYSNDSTAIDLKPCGDGCLSCSIQNICEICSYGYYLKLLAENIQGCEQCAVYNAKNCILFDKTTLSNFSNNTIIDYGSYNSDYNTFLGRIQMVSLECIEEYYLDSSFQCVFDYYYMEYGSFFSNKNLEVFTSEENIKLFLQDLTSFQSSLTIKGFKISFSKCNISSPAILSPDFSNCISCPAGSLKCYYGYYNQSWINYTNIQLQKLQNKSTVSISTEYYDNLTLINELCSQSYSMSLDNFSCIDCNLLILAFYPSCQTCTYGKFLINMVIGKKRGNYSLEIDHTKLYCTSCDYTYGIVQVNEDGELFKTCEFCLSMTNCPSCFFSNSTTPFCLDCYNLITTSYSKFLLDFDTRKCFSLTDDGFTSDPTLIDINSISSLAKTSNCFMFGKKTLDGKLYYFCMNCKNSEYYMTYYPQFTENLCGSYSNFLYSSVYESIGGINFTSVLMDANLEDLWTYLIVDFDPNFIIQEARYTLYEKICDFSNIQIDKSLKNCISAPLYCHYDAIFKDQSLSLFQCFSCNLNYYSVWFIPEIYSFFINYYSSESMQNSTNLIYYNQTSLKNIKDQLTQNIYDMRFFLNDSSARNTSCYSCKLGCSNCSFNQEKNNLGTTRDIIENYINPECTACYYDTRKIPNYIYDYNRKTCRYCPLNWSACRSLINKTIIIDSNYSTPKYEESVIKIPSFDDFQNVVGHLFEEESIYFLNEMVIEEINLTVLISPNESILNSNINLNFSVLFKKVFFLKNVNILIVGSYINQSVLIYDHQLSLRISHCTTFILKNIIFQFSSIETNFGYQMFFTDILLVEMKNLSFLKNVKDSDIESGIVSTSLLKLIYFLNVKDLTVDGLSVNKAEQMAMSNLMLIKNSSTIVISNIILNNSNFSLYDIKLVYFIFEIQHLTVNNLSIEMNNVSITNCELKLCQILYLESSSSLENIYLYLNKWTISNNKLQDVNLFYNQMSQIIEVIINNFILFNNYIICNTSNNYFLKGYHIFLKNLNVIFNNFTQESFLYNSFKMSNTQIEYYVIDNTSFKNNIIDVSPSQLSFIYIYAKVISGVINKDTFIFRKITIINETYAFSGISVNNYFFYFPLVSIYSLIFDEIEMINSKEIIWFYTSNIQNISIFNLFFEKEKILSILNTMNTFSLMSLKNFDSLTLRNVSVSFFALQNHSLINLEGNSVNIQNCDISYNYIKSMSYFVISFIKFIGDSLIISDSIFNSNFLDISEDIYRKSTSSLYFYWANDFSSVTLNSCIFKNSSPGNIYINSDVIEFTNVSMYNSNYTDNTFFFHDYSIENFTTMLSNSLFGFCNLNFINLTIYQCNFNRSQSITGLDFSKIATSINISNSNFSNIVSSADGGALKIQLSTYTPDLYIWRCRFTNILALGKGGVIFFEGSSDINITLKENYICNSYSNDSGAILYTENTKKFQLNIQNMEINNECMTENYFNLENIVLSSLLELNIDNQFSEAIFNIEKLEISNIHCNCSFIYQTQGFFSLKDAIFKNNTFGSSGMIYLSQLNQNITILNSSFVKNSFFIGSFLTDLANILSSFWGFNSSRASLIFIENPTSFVAITKNSFQNNSCFHCVGGSLCLILEVDHSGVLLENNIYFDNKEASVGGAIYISSQVTVIKSTVTIKSCIFESNSAYYYGGALYIANGFLNLIDLLFHNNSLNAFNVTYSTQCVNATDINCISISNIIENKGGAIFYEGYSALYSSVNINTSSFSFNLAGIGGAIFNYDSLINILSDVNFSNNNASLYGPNIYSAPTKIKLVKDSVSGIREIFESGTYEIKNFRSSDVISSLTFKLYDDSDNPIELYENPTEIEIKILQSSDLNDSNNYQIQGSTTINQANNEGLFTFDSLTFIGSQLLSYNVTITTPIIQDPTYFYVFSITFRSCLKGERYISSQNTCEKCSSGSYSLSENSSFCSSCQSNMKNCEGDQIIVIGGFWRYDKSTDLIEKCTDTEDFCFAEDDQRFNDSSSKYYNLSGTCAEGHIGALCASCDMYKTVWPERYSKTSKTKCGKCSDISFNVGILIGFLILNVISIALSVKGMVTMIDRDISMKILRKLGYSFLNIQSSKTSIYLKLLVTYCQIISAVTSFQLSLPKEIDVFPDSVGNPTETLLYSTDCFIVEIFERPTYPPFIYVKTVFTFLMPFVYLLLFCIFYFILVFANVFKNRMRIFYTAFFFVMIYMQPNVVSIFINMLSCKDVGGRSYVKADLAYECYSAENIKYSMSITLPALLIWTFIIPILILWRLFKARKNLTHVKNRIKYGFLYTEYKAKAYYWEFVKMYEKLIITLFLSFFDTQIEVKGMMVLLSILIYFLLLIYAKPYKIEEYNYIDVVSCIIEYFTIFFGIFAYKNTFVSLVYIAYLIILIVNLVFIYMITIRLLRSALSDQISVIDKILPLLKKYLPCCFKWVILKKDFKTLALWQKVRRAVLRYLKVKNLKEKKLFKERAELNPIILEKLKIKHENMENQSLLKDEIK